MMTRLISKFTRGTVLWLLLAVTLVKGIAWSILVPPWHAPDESTHFAYAQMIERDHTLHPDLSFWRPWEVGISWELAQMQRVRYDPGTPLDFSDRKKIASELERLVLDSARRNSLANDPAWSLGFREFSFTHPPLYYLLAAIPQELGQDTTIFVRILLDRWLSVLLGVIATALAYCIGQIIWQNEPWALLLATLVSFHPMFSFVMAIINNGALEIVFFSACLLVLLQILRHGLSARRASILGILLGASLLTRTSLVSLFPLCFFAFVWIVVQLARANKLNLRTVALWVPVFVIPIILAGWWYVDVLANNQVFAADPGTTFRPQPHLNLLEAFLRYDWVNTYQPLLAMYWGNFGWLDTPMSPSVIVFLTSVTITAIAATSWNLLRRIGAPTEPTSIVPPFVIVYLGLATLTLVVFYAYLDLRILTLYGGRFGLQGRYFLPPVVAQMAWLVIGLVSPSPARLRRAWMWIVATGMVALNIYSLFSVITLRYYGARNLFLVADRAAVLQPISADTILFLCAIFFLLIGALVPALWQAFEDAPSESEELCNPSHKTE